jgi:hypothetical protein
VTVLGHQVAGGGQELLLWLVVRSTSFDGVLVLLLTLSIYRAGTVRIPECGWYSAHSRCIITAAAVLRTARTSEPLTDLWF